MATKASWQFRFPTGDPQSDQTRQDWPLAVSQGTGWVTLSAQWLASLSAGERRVFDAQWQRAALHWRLAGRVLPRAQGWIDPQIESLRVLRVLAGQGQIEWLGSRGRPDHAGLRFRTDADGQVIQRGQRRLGPGPYFEQRLQIALRALGVDCHLLPQRLAAAARRADRPRSEPCRPAATPADCEPEPRAARCRAPGRTRRSLLLPA